MSPPRRVQLRRTKGWRKPEGCIVVARPSKWGNPFRVGDLITPDRAEWGVVASDHAPWERKGVNGTGWQDFTVETAEQAVALYRTWVMRSLLGGWTLAQHAENQLRGHDLACWCPLSQPCHADVLLDLANREAR